MASDQLVRANIPRHFGFRIFCFLSVGLWEAAHGCKGRQGGYVLVPRGSTWREIASTVGVSADSAPIDLTRRASIFGIFSCEKWECSAAFLCVLLHFFLGWRMLLLERTWRVRSCALEAQQSALSALRVCDKAPLSGHGVGR